MSVQPIDPDRNRINNAIAAAATQAGQGAAHSMGTQQRAIAGFRLAAGNPPANAGAVARATADVAGNAQHAMSRVDLPPAIRAQVENVLQRLGNGVMDGTVAPHINDTFRHDIQDLANQDFTSDRFKGALSQLTRAAQVVDQVTLNKGTKLAYDPLSGQPETQSQAGLPVLNVDKLDADLYYQSRDGALHIESTKYSASTLADTLKSSAKGSRANPTQMQRQYDWASQSTPTDPRRIGYSMMDNSSGFKALMDDRNLKQLGSSIPADQQSLQNILIGDKTYSFNQLQTLNNQLKTAAQAHVDGLGLDKTISDPAALKTARAQAFKDFYGDNMNTPQQAARLANTPDVGTKQPSFDPLSDPSIKEGAAWGGVASGVISTVQQLSQGKLTGNSVKQIATDTATGTVVGGLMAKGEQLLTPIIDKGIGNFVQQKAGQLAGTLIGEGGAESAGLAARTVISRLGGSTIVGAAITTGISAWQNRDGLMKGDSKAYGNVVADATVGVASVAGATLAGAAIGSVVPVAGTAVGAVVGFGVGMAITYGTQVSGVRDAIANGVAQGIDDAKSTVSHAFSAVASWF